MIDGTRQVVTGPGGYLDPAKPPAQLSGLGARMLIDGLLAMNAAESASSVAEWSTDLPTRGCRSRQLLRTDGEPGRGSSDH